MTRPSEPDEHVSGRVVLTPSVVSELLRAEPALGVSAFLPTHIHGAEIRQGPIRLKNLLTAAAGKLAAAGLPADRVEALLAPAGALVEDYRFWQHQGLGLALFLSEEQHWIVRVPSLLEDQAVVGRRFHLTPLLPLLAADGAFRVLSLTAHRSRLLTGSRSGLEPDPGPDLPTLATTSAESDYENPVQASPVARPNTGSIVIGNAQVYGESPAEWRTRQLVELAQAVAAAVDTRSRRHPLPVVVVADAALGGHFRRFTDLGPLLVDVVELNPEALGDDELHETAYRAVRPRLETQRQEAVSRFAELTGRGDRRAVGDRTALVRAAARGQVEVLLLRLHPTVWGHFDLATDRLTDYGPDEVVVEDLYGEAAARTLAAGGTVHVLDDDDLPGVDVAGAILRFVAAPDVPATGPGS